MLNQIVLVGRLTKDVELRETESGKKVANICIAVPKSFKNDNGEYDTDFVDCTLWSGIAENTSDYCQKGSLVGVKGRLNTQIKEQENGETTKIVTVVAEKVTFLNKTHEKNQKTER